MDGGQTSTNDSNLPCGGAKGPLAQGTQSLPKLTCAGANKVCARATPCRETDFYTPPVLGGAALFDNSAAAVYKNHVP